MATPLIEALGRMGYRADVICTANYPESISLLIGWNRIDKISPNPSDFKFEEYEKILLTPWFGMPTLFMGMTNILGVNTDILQHLPEVVANMGLARELGYRGEIPKPHVEFSPNRDFSMYEGCVGFHNGANPKWPFKRWPYFHELAKKFERVVLVGSLQDKQEGFGDNVYDFQGFLPLTDTAALIRVCKLFVTNDSGMMHLADALGVKTYAIFGPTSQTKNKPPDVIPISKGLGCQPCQHTEKWGSCRTIECMTSLLADEVYGKIMEREK